ncbi:hypothetical protein D3C86_1903890 [compost metagenome]
MKHHKSAQVSIQPVGIVERHFHEREREQNIELNGGVQRRIGYHAGDYQGLPDPDSRRVRIHLQDFAGDIYPIEKTPGRSFGNDNGIDIVKGCCSIPP